MNGNISPRVSLSVPSAQAKAISNAESASEYQFDEYGEIQAWHRYADLSDYSECREYFETWLQDNHCMSVDWENDCLLRNEGDSIVIQDDTRHDNGVWMNGKCIIDEKEYKNEGEVDESKRNSLIEAYMEKTGYFPGVFRADSHGNVFYANTKE